MSLWFGKLRALFARLSTTVRVQPRFAGPLDAASFGRVCKERAFWSASDAGLSGPIEAFDGSVLHRAADGLLTIRMTLEDSQQRRAPGDAATIILRSLAGLRVLLLLEIDGRRYTSVAPNVNPGVRELCQNFTNRTESAG